MGAKEINNGVNTMSPEELQAAADISSMEVGGLPASLEEASKWLTLKTEKLGKLKTGDLSKDAKENIASKVRKEAGVSTAINKSGDSIVTGTLVEKKEKDNSKSNPENIQKTSEISNVEEISEWEEKGIMENKEFSDKKEEIFKNIDAIENGTVNQSELRNIILEVEDEYEHLNKQYSNLNSKDFDNKKIYGEENDNFGEELETQLEGLSAKLSKLRVKYNEFFPENPLSTDVEINKNLLLELRQISSTDFLSNYTQEQRLQFITTQRLSGTDLKADEITFTFSFEGVFNRELYMSTTAGQVLPKNVGVVSSKGVEYSRSALLGEFFSQDGKRLKIGEETTLTEIGYRSETDIMKLETIPAEYKNSPFKTEAHKRGINPDLFESIAGEAIKNISDKHYQKVVIEELLTSFDRYRDINGVGGQEFTTGTIKNSLAQQNVIASLFHSIYSDGKDNYSGGKGVAASLAKEYGINSEVISTTQLGKRIVSFLERRNYAAFSERKNNCGKNVGMALSAFGIPGLPRSGRHGYKWAGFLENNPMFEEKSINAKDAPAGSVISYDKGSGGSNARQKYGHVEIALGNGRGYYFGKVAHNPGGSNHNPQQKDYRVFVPRGGESSTTKIETSTVKQEYVGNYGGSTLTNS